MGRLNPTAKRGRYLIDNGYTLLEFLLAGTVNVETGGIESRADMDVLQFEFTSLEVLLLIKINSNISSPSS